MALGAVGGHVVVPGRVFDVGVGDEVGAVGEEEFVFGGCGAVAVAVAGGWVGEQGGDFAGLVGVDCPVGGEAVEAEDAERGGHSHGGVGVYLGKCSRTRDLGDLDGWEVTFKETF